MPFNFFRCEVFIVGISISSLSGSGLFARANETKNKTEMSEIGEFATMRIYELYIESANNMDAVNDATIMDKDNFNI